MVSFWYLSIPTAQVLIGTGLGTVAVRYCCSRVLCNQYCHVCGETLDPG